MPTYDYICLTCGHRFEKFQGINESPLDSCPQCAGVVKRVITGGSGFIMKDGGTRNKAVSKLKKPSCGKEVTCCGSQYSCGKSEKCRS